MVLINSEISDMCFYLKTVFYDNCIMYLDRLDTKDLIYQEGCWAIDTFSLNNMIMTFIIASMTESYEDHEIYIRNFRDEMRFVFGSVGFLIFARSLRFVLKLDHLLLNSNQKWISYVNAFISDMTAKEPNEFKRLWD